MTAPLWTAADAAEATGGRSTTDWHATGVSIDTRTIEPGDLFVALKDVRDGHDFVAQALEKGAAAALVSRIPDGLSDNSPLLIVDEVQSALEALGRAGRDRTAARIVAITGSVGKTSTKEMLRAVLSGQGRVHASAASYNNHWGVPLTLARMPADTDFGVIEIGMNHPGEIAPLARMTRPHVVLITTVAAAHLEAFAGIEDIAVEKASIIEGLERGGAAVLNADCSTAAILQAKARDAGCRNISFGGQGNEFVMKSVVMADEKTIAQATAHGDPLLFKIAAAGRHFAMNGLGALAAAEALGVDLALAAHDLGRWRPYVGRGARETICLDVVDTEMTLELIDDSYNANPTSMEAALEVLAAAEVTNDIGRVSKGRRIAFLGDMKELGSDAQSMHAGLADLGALKTLDRVHCIGPLMKSLWDVLPEHQRGIWAETAKEILPQVPRRLDSGDVVLVKGSQSMGLAQIVDVIRKMGHRMETEEEQDNA